jgi:hypothetical protein
MLILRPGFDRLADWLHVQGLHIPKQKKLQTAANISFVKAGQTNTN